VPEKIIHLCKEVVLCKTDWHLYTSQQREKDIHRSSSSSYQSIFNFIKYFIKLIIIVKKHEVFNLLGIVIPCRKDYGLLDWSEYSI
jgi:hypothetical protein